MERIRSQKSQEHRKFCKKADTRKYTRVNLNYDLSTQNRQLQTSDACACFHNVPRVRLNYRNVSHTYFHRNIILFSQVLFHLMSNKIKSLRNATNEVFGLFYCVACTYPWFHRAFIPITLYGIGEIPTARKGLSMSSSSLHISKSSCKDALVIYISAKGAVFNLKLRLIYHDRIFRFCSIV